MHLSIEIYRDKSKEHRWRVRAKNGKIICAGTEGYKNKQDMMDAITAVMFELEFADIKPVPA